MGRNSNDYTGMKFGKLIVMRKTDKKDIHGNFLWECKCDCGNIYYTIGSKLKYRRSCGCLSEPIIISKYIGKEINDWYLIEKSFKDDKGWYIKCQCLLCGNKKDVNIYNIINGRSKNCGCERKRNLSSIKRKHTSESLQSHNFGRLTVKREYGKDKYGKILYECSCDCGNKSVVVLGNSLLTGHTTSCGCIRTSWNTKIKLILEELGYEAILEKQVNIINENIRWFRFDVYVKELNLAIEYDGECHFIPIDWGGDGDEIAYEKFKQVQNRDNIKDKYCEENNINLLRIPYTEKNNMKEIIINKIKTITYND